jgi:hypothetical protein
MDALAQSRGDGLIGCTQITEINATPGVTLAGTLPAPYELEGLTLSLPALLRATRNSRSDSCTCSPGRIRSGCGATRDSRRSPG